MTTPSPTARRRAALAWTLRAALAALLPAAAPATRAARGERATQLYAQAVAAFRSGRFPDAYGRFVELADLGDAEAARLALWMYQRGPTLFGSDWDATPDQIAQWTALATRRGLPPL